MNRLLALSSLTLTLLSCGQQTAQGVDNIRPASRAAATVPVETLVLRAQDFAERFETAGVVEAEEEVTVSAEISGRILVTYGEIGDAVRRGSHLVSLDQSEINARIRKIEAQLARARTQYEWARKDHERQQELFSQEIAAERAFDEASRLVDTSRNEVAAAEADLELARVDLERSTIKSPISGTVAKRLVAAGEYVREGTELFEIVATERVKFVFSVAERDVVAIERGVPMDIHVDTHPGRTFHGDVTAISPAGNRQTRTFRVEVKIENQDSALLPGMSGRTTVVRQQFADVFLLPEEVVMRDQNGTFVFLDRDGRALRAPVSILSQIGDRAVVASDLGSRYDCIILGQSALSDGTPIRVRRRREEIPTLSFD